MNIWPSRSSIIVMVIAGLLSGVLTITFLDHDPYFFDRIFNSCPRQGHASGTTSCYFELKEDEVLLYGSGSRGHGTRLERGHRPMRVGEYPDNMTGLRGEGAYEFEIEGGRWEIISWDEFLSRYPNLDIQEGVIYGAN